MKKLIIFALACALSLSLFSQVNRTSNRLIKQYHKEFNVRVYGATGDGVTDDTEAIQAAIDAGGSNCKIIIPTGDYVVTSTLTIASDRVNIVGDGKYATFIYFTPGAAGDTTLFLWEKANGSMIVQCAISQLGISEGDNYTKTAFEIVDADVFNMDNIAVYPWSSTNHDAIVLHTKGRDLFSISNVDFWGDRPVFLDKNPNYTGISVDHFNFNNCYFAANLEGTGYHPCVEVNSNDTVNISHLNFTGNQAWVGGTAGFYWDAYITNQISYSISFNNVRFEQGENNAWCIYIDHSYGLNDVQFNNVLASDKHGFYLRKTRGVSFRNVSQWSNTNQDTALNVDNTVVRISFANTLFAQNAIITDGGMLGLSGSWNKTTPSVASPFIEFYSIPTTENLLINPAVNTTQQYSQISSPSVTIATTDSIEVCSELSVGFLFVMEKGSSYTSAIYSLHGASIEEVSDINYNYTTVRGTGDSYNLYWNSAMGRMILENNKAGNAIFVLVFIGFHDFYVHP